MDKIEMYIWNDLDSKRPTMEEYEKQENEVRL